MMLAEMTGLETASLIGGFVFGAGGLIIGAISLFRKTEITPQPFPVHLVEELHREFANRSDFIEHVKDNDKQRAIIHQRLDQAIADYNDKFQALPNELVTLLRNTGVIK